MSVSIRDLAHIAGVSPATVSRVLNDDPSFSINKNTRKRIIDIADRVQYSKSKTPRGPKSVNKKMTIGLILRHDMETELRDPYFHDLHEGLNEEGAKWRFNIELIFMMHDKNKDWSRVRDYGAVIIVGETGPEVINKIKEINQNIIIIDAFPRDEDCAYICNDFSSKMNSILEYLFEAGHKNIAYIGGQISYVNIEGETIFLPKDDRQKTYESWMCLHKLKKYTNSFVTDWTSEGGLEAGERMLSMKKLPTAVVVASDPMAIGVYEAIANHNLKVGKDISVFSFDDIEAARYLKPSLSSVYIDSTEIGRIAIRLARTMVIEPKQVSLTIRIHSKLRIRNSVRKIKQ